MADYFVGEIGIELPIVGSNFAEYARSEIQHLSNTAKGMLNPLSPEALSNVTNGVVGASEGVWGNMEELQHGRTHPSPSMASINSVRTDLPKICR